MLLQDYVVLLLFAPSRCSERLAGRTHVLFLSFVPHLLFFLTFYFFPAVFFSCHNYTLHAFIFIHFVIASSVISALLFGFTLLSCFFFCSFPLLSSLSRPQFAGCIYIQFDDPNVQAVVFFDNVTYFLLSY